MAEATRPVLRSGRGPAVLVYVYVYVEVEVEVEVEEAASPLSHKISETGP